MVQWLCTHMYIVMLLCTILQCYYTVCVRVLTSSSNTRNSAELSAASSKNMGSSRVCSTHRTTPMATTGYLTHSNSVGTSTCREHIIWLEQRENYNYKQESEEKSIERSITLHPESNENSCLATGQSEWLESPFANNVIAKLSFIDHTFQTESHVTFLN